jgi:hypothetical protein
MDLECSLHPICNQSSSHVLSNPRLLLRLHWHAPCMPAIILTTSCVVLKTLLSLCLLTTIPPSSARLSMWNKMHMQHNLHAQRSHVLTQGKEVAKIVMLLLCLALFGCWHSSLAAPPPGKAHIQLSIALRLMTVLTGNSSHVYCCPSDSLVPYPLHMCTTEKLLHASTSSTSTSTSTLTRHCNTTSMRRKNNVWTQGKEVAESDRPCGCAY